tara:strand:+ start:1479 stop:1700 length:222 start_codon:yes stop_codon:yes gene_type:complete
LRSAGYIGRLLSGLEQCHTVGVGVESCLTVSGEIRNKAAVPKCCRLVSLAPFDVIADGVTLPIACLVSFGKQL